MTTNHQVFLKFIVLYCKHACHVKVEFSIPHKFACGTSLGPQGVHCGQTNLLSQSATPTIEFPRYVYLYDQIQCLTPLYSAHASYTQLWFAVTQDSKTA